MLKETLLGCRQTGKASVLRDTERHVIADKLASPPLSKTFDCVATVYLREKLLVTQLIENFPKFDGSRYVIKVYPTPNRTLVPSGDQQDSSPHLYDLFLQIRFNSIFISICLFLYL